MFKVVLGRTHEGCHRSLCLVRVQDGFYVMSNWTGELVYPWEVRKVFGLVKDFRLELIYG